MEEKAHICKLDKEGTIEESTKAGKKEKQSVDIWTKKERKPQSKCGKRLFDFPVVLNTAGPLFCGKRPSSEPPPPGLLCCEAPGDKQLGPGKAVQWS